jgi:hypothetical protein
MTKGSRQFSERCCVGKQSRNRGIVPLAFVLALTSICVRTTAADALRMTKIVFQRVSSNVALDSFAAKPKTICLVGDKYWRVEEPPNPERGTHNLSITREPDGWIINLADKTGRHMLDPGPTFIARLPIIWVPKANGQTDAADKGFEDLNFGDEVRFFYQHKARDLGLRTVEGKECKAFAIKSDGREAVLLVAPDTDKPVQLDVTRDGKPDFTIRYLSYETDLPFDPSLFEPPPGIKITESK